MMMITKLASKRSLSHIKCIRRNLTLSPSQSPSPSPSIAITRPRQLYGFASSQTRSIVIGRASPPHTKAFIKSSNSSLFHKIEVPGLYINPLIVQPSQRFKGKSTRDQFIQFEHAVRTHKANCFCIYHHDGVQADTDWYFHHMDPLLSRNQLRREDVVLMAKVGISVFPNQDIETQLEQIKARCGISHIDIIILEVCLNLN